MSMSTPGDIRRPSSAKPSATPADGGGRDGDDKDGPKPAAKTSTGAKTGGAKPGTAKAGGTKAGGTKAGGAKLGTARPGTGKVTPGRGSGSKTPPGKGGGGGKGRPPFVPVRVAQERNWGPILMFAAASVVGLLIIGFASYQVWKSGASSDWQKRASGIDGIVNFRESDPESLKAGHAWGPLTYKQNPPVGGEHNFNWQNCQGDVYTSQISNEQAVHSMEHGAVWITYRPDVPQDQIDKLAAKVKDRSFMMLSPYPGLDKAISLQAWGYQLKVDNANDPRIDEFIQALRQNASQEPQAGCSEGITDATVAPLDLGKPAATTAPTPGASASPAG
jgi:hypothetical protein